MSIEIHSLRKTLGGRLVLEDVSLTVETGRVLFIVGPSGAGKSVLMRHVIGLLVPDEGEIRVDGDRVDTLSERELVGVRKACGFVFQQPALLDFLTLEGNLLMPLQRRLGLSRSSARARAQHWLERVGALDEADSYPDQVGAGVRKRVSIARVLSLEPRHVVYDEPTTGLDPVAARRVDSLIRSHAGQANVTSVVISHDLRSLAIEDELAFLHAGRLHARGTLGELWRSRDPLVRQFLSGAADGPI